MPSFETAAISSPNPLQDTFGRRLEYLRLSVTDRCNFRCAYCLPEGCGPAPAEQPLSLDEIERLVRAFAALGVWKVRVTGGEPTLRQDIVEMVRRIAAVPGIRRVGLTTNGYRLDRLAPALGAAGLRSLNVSLDSLDPARFERVTGSTRFANVVAGLVAAMEAGIPTVKVNVVLLRGMEERELDRFLAWTHHVPLAVRFIELMRTGDNEAFYAQNHVPVEAVRRRLEERGWARLERERSDGPAVSYGCEGHEGRVGLIAPYSPGFCDACNRVRVSSMGDLRLCLFGDEGVSLRPLLQSDALHGELVKLIEAAVVAKPASHRLLEGRFGSTSSLAVIGG
jgi:cyclic pyranopterin phosphate synthase